MILKQTYVDGIKQAIQCSHQITVLFLDVRWFTLGIGAILSPIRNMGIHQLAKLYKTWDKTKLLFVICAVNQWWCFRAVSKVRHQAAQSNVGPWEQIKYANHEKYMSHEIIMHVYNELRGLAYANYFHCECLKGVHVWLYWVGGVAAQ